MWGRFFFLNCLLSFVFSFLKFFWFEIGLELKYFKVLFLRYLINLFSFCFLDYLYWDEMWLNCVKKGF